MKYVFFILFIMFIQFGANAQSDEQNLARQYVQSGDQEKACLIFQKLFKEKAETFFQDYINCLVKLKRYGEAESTAKRMMREYPEHLQYQLALGNLYREQGNQAKSDLVDDQIINNLPTDPEKITEAATQVYSTGRADLAIKIFIQGRKLLRDEYLFAYPLISLYGVKRNKYLMADEYLKLLQNNPQYLQQAQNNISAQFDNPEDYLQLKKKLLKLIQKYPQQSAYTALLTWEYLQQKEFENALNQAIALNRRLNENGDRIFQLCQILVANEAYDTAIRGYEFLIEKKTTELFIPAKIELINVQNLKINSGMYVEHDLLSLTKDYYRLLNEFGRNVKTAFAMQNLAKLEAFKLNNFFEAEKLLEEVIKMKDVRPALLADCKMDLGDVYLLDDQPWEATLRYSQVEKEMPNTTVAQEARFRNARLAYYTGDFEWAKAQLDVLKAATSQLIANDALNLSLLIDDNTTVDSAGTALKMYARAEFLIFKEQYNQALTTLDSLDNLFPGNALSDDLLMAKAKIFIKQRKDSQAVLNLQKIADEYPTDLWADDAVFMLADLYEHRLKNKEKAQELFKKIITHYPGSLWLNEARKRFRVLRGDLTLQ